MVTYAHHDAVDAATAARLVLEAHRLGRTSVEAVVLGGPFAGTRFVLREAGPDPLLHFEASGLQGAERDVLASAIADAARSFIRGSSTPGPRAAHTGIQEIALPDSEPVEVYFELYPPTPELVIVGAGHLALPLSEVGRLLGFRVVVLDDRPDFARRDRFPAASEVVRVDFRDPFANHPPTHLSHHLLVTRGHRFDCECLRQLLVLEPPPCYIGMIGSRRRVRATFHQLVDEGFAPERLAGIRAPVGLDLGAETPAEIAIAVAAELVRERRGGTGLPLSEKERIAERFFGNRDAARTP